MTYQLLVLIALLFTSVSTGYASVQSYFNHNSSKTYTDPYRKLTRKGDDLEKVIIQQIKSARKSVFVAVQEIRLPLIAAALIERHKAGVDVRLIIENNYNHDSSEQRDGGDSDHEATRSADLQAFVDMNGNRKLEESEKAQRDAIYMLRKAKIPTMDDTFGGGRGSGLMHHKFVVVDERTTVISTANFTLSCIHGDFRTSASRGNANSLMVVESTSLADVFVDEFTQMWGNGRIGNFGLSKTYRGPRTVSVGGARLTVQFSPTSKRHGWEASVNGLIGKTVAKATKSVKGALFVFSDQMIADELEKKHADGVQMGFIIETKFAYREYSELLDMMGLEFLNSRCEPEAKNNPWEKPIKEGGMSGSNSGDILHHKFAVVDGKTVIMGSQNWTESANHQNDETLVVVESPSISGSYSREYNRIKGISVMGAPEAVKTSIRERESRCRSRR